MTKSYNYTSGYSTDNSSVEINVNGSVNVDVEITGQCKPGTGGSAGASYLRTTIDKRIFGELWDARTRLEAAHDGK